MTPIRMMSRSVMGMELGFSTLPGRLHDCV
jgi:hypothetical protein